jgi:hypothetical protein
MWQLHTPTDADRIADPAMRRVIGQRFSQLAEYEDFTFNELAQFWRVEPGDTIEQLEAATGLPIAHGWCSNARYPDSDFAPAWDVLQAHPSCYELVFVTSDSGYGIVLWIANDAADPVLLAMCAQYATPAL